MRQDWKTFNTVPGTQMNRQEEEKEKKKKKWGVDGHMSQRSFGSWNALTFSL